MTGFRLRPAITMPTLGVAISIGLLWYFHDRFWWPVDEGVYAYVAQRLLAGDVLHRDLIDLHAGYVNFIHAAALSLFGEDLLSLRYPLVVLSVVQAVLAAAIVRQAGPFAGAVAAVTVTAFSFIQFLNPSANWYALFVFFLVCWLMTRLDVGGARDLILMGSMLGLCFLVRQLSAVFLSMGVLTWLLMRLPQGGVGRFCVARTVLLLMAIGLCGYLWSKGSPLALLGFGLFPIATLVHCIVRVRATDRIVTRTLALLAAGAVLPFLPLAAYYIATGGFFAWLRDLLLTPLLIHSQDFIAHASYLTLFWGALRGLVAFSDPAAVLNGVLWLVLILAPAALGIMVLRDCMRGGAVVQAQPLPLMAIFYALVAIHYQISMYLLHAIAPVLLSFLCFGWKTRRVAMMPTLLLLSAIAVWFQAGQPLSRGIVGVIAGVRAPSDVTDGLPRSSLKIERAERDVYAAVLAHIESNAMPDEPLFAIPMDPELNFLSGRRAPVPYFGTPFGLRSRADMDETLEVLRRSAPLFVVYRIDDKYLSTLGGELVEEIRRLALDPVEIGPFRLFRLPAPATPAPTRE